MAPVKNIDARRTATLEAINHMIRAGGTFVASTNGAGGKVQGLAAAVLEVIRGLGHQALEEASAHQQELVLRQKVDIDAEFSKDGLAGRYIWLDVTSNADSLARQTLMRAFAEEPNTTRRGRFARVAGSRHLSLLKEDAAGTSTRVPELYAMLGPRADHVFAAAAREDLQARREPLAVISGLSRITDADFWFEYMADYNQGLALSRSDFAENLRDMNDYTTMTIEEDDA